MFVCCAVNIRNSYRNIKYHSFRLIFSNNFLSPKIGRQYIKRPKTSHKVNVTWMLTTGGAKSQQTKKRQILIDGLVLYTLDLPTYIKSRYENPGLGNVLLQNAPFLRMYADYVRNFDQAMELLRTWTERSSAFGNIIHDIQVRLSRVHIRTHAAY